MYARNPDIGPGKVAYGGSQILYRPLSYDQEGETQNFFQLLDKQSLQVCINRLLAYCKGGILNIHIWAWLDYLFC